MDVWKRDRDGEREREMWRLLWKLTLLMSFLLLFLLLLASFRSLLSLSRERGREREKERKRERACDTNEIDYEQNIRSARVLIKIFSRQDLWDWFSWIFLLIFLVAWGWKWPARACSLGFYFCCSGSLRFKKCISLLLICDNKDIHRHLKQKWTFHRF